MERSAGASLADILTADRDDVVVLQNISWATYETLLAAREKRQPRMAFLDGVLELVMTGRPHELDKKLLARLVEAYAEASDQPLNGGGSTTFKKKAKQAGLEPDECYWLGSTDTPPDLAIEVVHSNSRIDKLEIYRRLTIREVWRFVERELEVHVLVDGTYHERSRSQVLRGIDLDELARLCDPANYDAQMETVRAYRESVKRRRRKSRR